MLSPAVPQGKERGRVWWGLCFEQIWTQKELELRYKENKLPGDAAELQTQASYVQVLGSTYEEMKEEKEEKEQRREGGREGEK